MDFKDAPQCAGVHQSSSFVYFANIIFLILFGVFVCCYQSVNRSVLSAQEFIDLSYVYLSSLKSLISAFLLFFFYLEFKHLSLFLFIR